MHRFFIEADSHRLIPGELVLLPDKLAHQVRDVLHLVVGEQLVLLDNSGDEIYCTVKSSSKVGVSVLVGERQTGKNEPPVRIILCQGLLKSARFEWILEKGTELGVSTFVPILCRRSTAGLEDAGGAKIQRWQRILQEATEQCGGARRPALLPIRPLAQALREIPAGAIAVMCWEEERAQSLRAVLQTVQSQAAGAGFVPAQPLTVVLFIGPEGGLLKEEVQLAQQHGVHIATLGTRILRAETAALVAVSQFLTGS